MADKLLSIHGITMEFPGVKALSDVSFDVERGDCIGLCGENGAGKSTLIKVLTGIYRQTAGTFEFDGEEARFKSPLDAQMKGLSVVHQEIKLVDTISVKENVFLGRPPRNKLGLVDWSKMRKEAQALLDRLGVTLDPDMTVSNLTVAQQQIVEICKALSFESKLLILDEPSAVLTNREMDLLYVIIDKLKEQGITIIYISHRLEEVFRICNKVIVLRDGLMVAEELTGNLDRDKLIALMVGRQLGKEFPEPVCIDDAEEVLRVEELNHPGMLKNISFSLKKGEILGLGGLVGAGRSETVRAIFGLDKEATCRLYLKGRQVKIKTPRDAIKHGLAFLSEDRKKEGLVLGESIARNIVLPNLDSACRGGLLSERTARKLPAE